MIYLDNAATTIVAKDILNNYFDLLKECYGNSASNHKFGQESFRLLSQSREKIRTSFGLKDDYEVVFTSGASEANNLAIKGVAFGYLKRGKHLITTNIEHPSILNTFKQLQAEFGFEVTILNVNAQGLVDIDDLRKNIRKDTILISVMAVNNEVGMILNINEVANVAKEYPKIFFHSDTTQAIGKIELDYSNIDLFVLSAHKLNGLKGSGALIKKKHISLVPLICGGGQEFNYRSGTNNVPSEVILAKTIRLALTRQQENYAHAKQLTDYLKSELIKIDEVVINTPAPATPFIFNFSLLKHKASVVVEALSLKQIMVSTISACSSKKNEISHVLKALQKDSVVASNPIRISVSRDNTMEEIKTFIIELKDILATTR